MLFSLIRAAKAAGTMSNPNFNALESGLTGRTLNITLGFAKNFAFLRIR